MCGDSRLTFFGSKKMKGEKTNCSSVLFLCYLHKSLKRSPQCLSRTRPRKRKEDNIFAKFFFVIPSPLSCDVSVELVRHCSVYSYYLRSCCYPVFFFFTGNLWPLASKGLFQRTAANCVLSLFVPVLPNPYWWCCERTPLDPVNKGRHNHEPFSVTLTVLSVTNEVLIRTPGHFDLVFLLHTSPSHHLFGLTVQHRPTVGGRRNQTVA